jgi:voltage-gated sodium channel
MTSSLNVHPEPVTRLQKFVSIELFKQTIAIMIVLNAIVLGALTFTEVGTRYHRYLTLADNLILGFFVFELFLKILAWRRSFFGYGWNIFDLIVVAVSLVPTSQTFAVLRAMRVLRILRLLHIVPMMRRITEALFRALPGMGAIIAVMALLIYVSAVIATNLFGHTDDPEVAAMFGDLPSSALSLFQVMTMDGWRFEVMQKVIDDGQPYAWIFFLIFLFIASFAVLNLFIAIFVDALQAEHESAQDERIEELDDKADDAKLARDEMIEILRGLSNEMAQLRNALHSKSETDHD